MIEGEEYDCHKVAYTSWFEGIPPGVIPLKPLTMERIHKMHLEWNDGGSLLRPKEDGVAQVKPKTKPKSKAHSLMPFGKHKGVALADIESNYLTWLLTLPDLKPSLRKAVASALDEK